VPYDSPGVYFSKNSLLSVLAKLTPERINHRSHSFTLLYNRLQIQTDNIKRLVSTCSRFNTQLPLVVHYYVNESYTLWQPRW
jgi:hypothetical protein